MTRFLRISVVLIMIVLGLGTMACAQIFGHTQFDVDLSNAADAKQKLRWLGGEKALQLTADGLGWGDSVDKPESGSFCLETIQPIGLGVSWRPTPSVIIKAKIERPADNGALYVRYSADARHWSSWQLLNSPERPNSTSADVQVFRQEIRVPNRSRWAYNKQLLKYMFRDDVAWTSDEEALCKELTAQNPNYFKNNIPFIGYVQFCYEGSLRSGERIGSIKVHMDWVVPGLSALPKDGNDYKNRQGVWRFKLPEQ